jgi:predicted kinase
MPTGGLAGGVMDGKKVNLIVVRGLQGSGKTRLTRWIEDEFKFKRVRADDIGIKRYGKPSDKSNPQRFNSENPEHRKYVIGTLRAERDKWLLKGKHVVIDAGVGSNEDYLLFSPESQQSLRERECEVERYLIRLRADFDVRVRRVQTFRGDYTEEELREKFSKSERKRREPKGLPTDVHLLDYENNTTDQLKEIKTDLIRRFGNIRWPYSWAPPEVVPYI